MSTMGAVTGIAIGTQSGAVVLLSGLVIIAVEALSMAAGTYISSKSARQAYEEVVKRLHRALHSKPAVERAHLIEYYMKCGLSRGEAAKVVEHMAKNHKALLLDLAAHEGKVSPDSYEDPKQSGEVMGLAYIIGGAVPLVFYLFLPPLTALPFSVASTLAFLFFVGLAKARVTGQRPFASALEMLAVSAAAAVIGFSVGRLASWAFGIKVN